uniref:Transmembrane protein n=1 Tax=Ditylenchus dipsaci TaxID=166011 RepID=A0A915E949_9BILA
MKFVIPAVLLSFLYNIQLLNSLIHTCPCDAEEHHFNTLDQCLVSNYTSVADETKIDPGFGSTACKAYLNLKTCYMECNMPFDNNHNYAECAADRLLHLSLAILTISVVFAFLSTV